MSSKKLYIFVGSRSLEDRTIDYSGTVLRLVAEMPQPEFSCEILDVRGYVPLTNWDGKTYYKPVLIIAKVEKGNSLLVNKQRFIKFVDEKLAPLMQGWGVSEVHVIGVMEGLPRMTI